MFVDLCDPPLLSPSNPPCLSLLTPITAVDAPIATADPPSMEARKLKLPKTFAISSPEISSISLDPKSLSLSLSHSDSSISLYPSLSQFSLPQFSLQSLSPISLSPPISSSTFLTLQNPSSSLTLFLSSSAISGGSSVLLRFWVLTKPSQFTKARVFCTQKGLEFDESKLGVVFNVPHGLSIRLFGSDNVFAMHSVSNKKIWVFAVKMESGDTGVSLKLMRCAEIECSKPVFSISVSFGFFILGEENGVRVFHLRPLVKGRVKKHPKENRDLENGKKFPNGVICSSGYSKGKSHKHNDSVKLKSVKLKQESKEYGAHFVEFKSNGIETERTKKGLQLVNSCSIQALSPYKFLVLNSDGDLHLLRFSNTALSSEIPFTMKQIPNTMRIQKLAVLPDIPTKTQYVWISDGRYSVHAIAFPGVDDSDSESSTKQCENQLIQCSVHQAIFCSEKIQEMVPLATNSVLILGQGSLFVYSIS